jgi:hypothetical protein
VRIRMAAQKRIVDWRDARRQSGRGLGFNFFDALEVPHRAGLI